MAFQQHQLLALALPLLFCSAAVTAVNQVMVTIYYESLCPDSVNLITKQITPVWNSPLGAHMNLTLVPYGKASMNKTEGGMYNFNCHHGMRECFGNKVHACALKHLISQDKQVKFINCTMAESKLKDQDAEYPTQMCAEKVEAPAEEIQNCANTTAGDELLYAEGEKTMKFQQPLAHVPSILFNDKYDQKVNDMAKTDFKQALCSRIEGTKPMECGEEPSGAPQFTATILPLAAGALLLSRL